MKKSIHAKLLPYLFLTPTLILMAVFSYYAIGNAVYTSFTDSAFGVSSRMVGFTNYIAAFKDEMFLTSFKNQAIITVTAVFNSVFFPLLASEILFFIKHKKVASFFKTAFVIPMLIPQIVTILIWKYLYNPNFGFNSILRALGMGGLTHNWLNEKSTALICIILIGFPFISSMYFLIMHTGLNAIGDELYEAAIVDGATSMEVVRYIHLPNIKSYIKVVVTLSLIGSLSGFGLIAATTGGGPGYSTMIPALQMYKIAFGDGKFGYASALGVVLFIVIILLTLASRKLLGEEE
ncbi:carbohydrate ABC transporter permease [Diplocloster agilis]|uniref:Sugar ABC transporter permease n=1 Tax=Diplocloster agilis TaxID=2850323 RepID=A0A949JYL2_9FIRM|nr:sugar ABC transporter permease [Suonthocola fibrivorans]MBU9736979.1 sugar ABC transporter permease [Diplocloster agilis]MBU9743316.1 sugar ABC transporter permease [Diplocloster agilis]MCU6732769.1 sugar ABC transporter permease [Suonthocola fibrivorans]SCI62393.1 sn-glycerol-3-phosphate transport system permease protein ugpA [uncultured Clostridium sp.]